LFGKEIAMTKPDDHPGVAGMLCFSLYSASHAFTQLYRPLLDKLSLTYPQYLVMVSLWKRDGQNVKELGNNLFLDSSTLTPLLKRLNIAGFITRTRNPQDEREVLLHLTEKGRALQGQADHVMHCIGDAVALDAKALDTLRETIDDLRNRLQAGAG
jgi:MarR family transcriptional regulator, organic hydroperoxide resistance regulator